jgi:transposase-like protein
MSKRRLVITAVLAGASQSEVARTYGVSQGWISRLMARYRDEGEAAFEARSRRPDGTPNATPPPVIDLVLRLRKQLDEAGLDAGADTIGWHLQHRHDTVLSRATINRILVRAGTVTPDPAKRPKSSYIRFEAEQPNQTWQSDYTHYRLTQPDGRPGPDTEIITWLDHLEHELRRLNILQKNSRPNHPTTCGKAERFQQTLKKWLRAQPVQPSTTAELQALLDQFATEYNQRRPHRSLPHHATPATIYTARPKATPGADRTSDTHDRVRHDKISKAGTVTLRVAGQLRHIGIGRTYAGTYVILLVHDLHVRVVNAATGELLRDLVIDPRRDYQPTRAPKGPTKN